MYFLQQIKTQFIAQCINYQSIEWGGNVDRTEQVDNKTEWLIAPEEADWILSDATWTARHLDGNAARLEAAEARLIGWEWDAEVVWQQWVDELWEERTDGLIQWPETGEENPASVWTASMETAQKVADRNDMWGAWDEEPPAWEYGEENAVEQPDEAELARRQQSLLADREATRERLSQAEPNSPEARAAQQEMSALNMFLNILQFGSVNPPSWAVDSQWNPAESSYSGGIGQPLSAEMLRQYWGVWHELASWIQQKGFPVYEGQPNYCGKNVWECMNAFGYLWLPNSGRNGADWKTICEARPSQFKKIDCRPEDAPAGALISYERNSGGSVARQKSGHIEIALWEGKWYYYGAVASQPGWSQKPPMEWKYSIFMPTSKHQRAVA